MELMNQSVCVRSTPTLRQNREKGLRLKMHFPLHQHNFHIRVREIGILLYHVQDERNFIFPHLIFLNLAFCTSNGHLGFIFLAIFESSFPSQAQLLTFFFRGLVHYGTAYSFNSYSSAVGNDNTRGLRTLSSQWRTE